MVDDKEILRANRANWDNRVPIHMKSKTIYNLEEFRKGKLSFAANEHTELGSQISLKDKLTIYLPS